MKSLLQVPGGGIEQPTRGFSVQNRVFCNYLKIKKYLFDEQLRHISIIKETKQYRHVWSRIGQFLEKDWKVVYLGETIELR
jgi:hypothetical protein